MFDDIRNETLSLTDAAKWLRHIVSDEMARIQRNRAIIFADSGPNPRADWAMAEAWKILAKRGPCAALRQEDHATLVAAGHSNADIMQLTVSLEMLSSDLCSTAHVNRMTRSFSDMTGRSDPPNTSIVLALRKLLIEGRAAAWSQVPADQGMEIASELASSIAADTARRERQDFLSAPELSNSAPGAGVLVREFEIEDTTATSAPQMPVVMPQPMPDELEFDPAISAVIERLIVQKDHAETSSVTQRQYRSFGALFIQITGLTDVRSRVLTTCLQKLGPCQRKKLVYPPALLTGTWIISDRCSSKLMMMALSSMRS